MSRLNPCCLVRENREDWDCGCSVFVTCQSCQVAWRCRICQNLIKWKVFKDARAS